MAYPVGEVEACYVLEYLHHVLDLCLPLCFDLYAGHRIAVLVGQLEAVISLFLDCLETELYLIL